MQPKTTFTRSARFHQGNFEDKFIAQKYYGERPIIYRSSWEYKYMISLERNPKVEKWSSEKIIIPYYMNEKIDGKVVRKKHNYHTDFIVHMKDGNIFVIEIKPKIHTPRYNHQIKTDPVAYKNACKWKAALEYCKQKGFIFKVLTEDSLFLNKESSMRSAAT
jgi:hypothetical protein